MLPHRLLVAFMMGALLAGTASAADTIRLRADQWMPFNGDPADSDLPGYGIELARTIFAEHDIVLDYQTLAWGDALKAVAAGEIEAVIGANKSEAEGLVVPAESVGEPRVALYVRHDNPWRYHNLASLLPIKLGVIEDYKYWENLDAYLEKHGEPRVVKLGGDTPLKDGLARLLKGEIDVFAESAPVFAWQIKADGLSPTQFRAAYTHEADPVYIAFSPKHPRAVEFARLFDEGVRKMRTKGQLATLLARYGQRDWKR